MIYHPPFTLTNRMTLLVAEIAELIGAWKAVNHNTLVPALRQLHLMDSKTIGTTPYSVKGEGDFSVDKPDYRDGKIYLLKTNLLSWKKDYDNHLMILDGTQWAFEIATESFYFRSGGSNNYPANIEFNRLLRAIRKLIERDFR